jgi:phosphohistidine phosphatase SixA
MPNARASITLAALLALASATADAQPLAGPDLIKALRGGGYVLLIRHARSPQAAPSADEADPGNPAHERQLDAAGQSAATRMGEAFRTLRLPIGEVWSSPAYRALQTVRLAGLPAPKIAPELGDGGASMRATSRDQAAWLQAKVATPPKPATDNVIVTHLPDITAAYAAAASGLADGEALVFHPDGRGPPAPVARIRIEDWPAFAADLAGRRP